MSTSLSLASNNPSTAALPKAQARLRLPIKAVEYFNDASKFSEEFRSHYKPRSIFGGHFGKEGLVTIADAVHHGLQHPLSMTGQSLRKLGFNASDFKPIDDWITANDTLSPLFKINYKPYWFKGGTFAKSGYIDITHAINHAQQKPTSRTAYALKNAGIGPLDSFETKLILKIRTLQYSTKQDNEDLIANIIDTITKKYGTIKVTKSLALKMQINYLYKLSCGLVSSSYQNIELLKYLTSLDPHFFTIEFIKECHESLTKDDNLKSLPTYSVVHAHYDIEQRRSHLQ